MTIKTIILIVFLGAATQTHAASFNKCVDAKGKVTYSDVPCEAGTNETEQKVHSKPNTEGERSAKEGYQEAAKIYGDMNRDKEQEQRKQKWKEIFSR